MQSISNPLAPAPGSDEPHGGMCCFSRTAGVSALAAATLNETVEAPSEWINAEGAMVETPFAPDSKLASRRSTLADAERIECAEAMLAAGKGGKSAIGAQNTARDIATAIRHAGHGVPIPPSEGWNVNA